MEGREALPLCAPPFWPTYTLSRPHLTDWSGSRTSLVHRCHSGMVTGVQRPHTVLLLLLHFLPSRSRDQQMEQELKVPTKASGLCSALSCLCFAGNNHSTVGPLDTDVALKALEPIPPPKTAVLQPRSLLWEALGSGPNKT